MRSSSCALGTRHVPTRDRFTRTPNPYLFISLFIYYSYIHSFIYYSVFFVLILLPSPNSLKTLNALYFWFILSACFRLLKKSPLIENTMQQRANADSVRSENEKVRQANEERLKEKRMVRVLFRFVSSPGARIARACSLCVLIFGCTRSPSLDTACLSLSLFSSSLVVTTRKSKTSDLSVSVPLVPRSVFLELTDVCFLYPMRNSKSPLARADQPPQGR